MKELADQIRERIRMEIRKIRSDKDLMSRIYIITLGMALLILAVCVRGPEQKGRVLTDKDGLAVGIERHSLNSGEKYDFEVKVKEGAEIITRQVSLSLQAVRDGKGGLGLTEEPGRDEEIDAGLDSVINEIEYSRKKKIILPTQLSDGTAISWTALTKRDYSLLILIPLIYVALWALCSRAGRTNDKMKETAKRHSILRGLPRFCNQLFLMMNAGMILSDAFEMIAAAML